MKTLAFASVLICSSGAAQVTTGVRGTGFGPTAPLQSFVRNRRATPRGEGSRIGGMEPNMTLLCSALEAAVLELESDAPSAWAGARRALVTYEVNAEDDSELQAAIESEDNEALGSIVSGWVSGERLLLVRDRDVLKRAMKAYRKRLKVTVLDAESSVSGGPMSAGRASNIVGIVPPERYPRDVWDFLVRQKRLLGDGHGTYELPPGG